MSQIFIKGAYIISMNSSYEIFENGDILIEDDKIIAVGNVSSDLIENDAEIVDASGKIVMPGLINTHVHLSQQLGRGLGDDVDLVTWLHERIWPYESNMDLEDSYVSSLACCMELIHSGVTTFAEPGGQEVDGMARAVKEAGIRGILARSSMDCGEGLPQKWNESTEKVLYEQEKLIDRWNGKENNRIKVWFGLRTIFNNSDKLIERTKMLSDKYNVGIHMHVAEIAEEVQFAKAERGHTTVEHLAKLGVLDSNFLAAHTVWLTDREIDLFRLYDVKVTHNPAAAMRVLGFARIPEMVDKGIHVSIGTDGAPSNNRMDIIDEMYLTTLIHKGRTLNSKTLPAEQIIKMTTIEGAKCLLCDKEVGSLEPGKKADLIVINFNDAGSLPVHDPIANIVYSMHSTNVESSMCDGRWIMKDRKILTVDENSVLSLAKDRAKQIVEKADIILPDRFPVIKIR